MKTSILIVNWNSKELLRECMCSIRATCSDLAIEVIVIDSASFDGCGEMLASEFPGTIFIQSQTNLGFGRANNLGFERATGDAVLILNPDTMLTKGALQRLLRELYARPDIGIVSPRLLNSDRSIQSSVHALPRPIRQAFDSELLRRVLSPFSLWAPPEDFAPKAATKVEAVAGTCMLLRHDTFRTLNGFSPEFFMYAEDMDLCYRVHQSGKSIVHVPDAEVIHHGGGSSVSQGSEFSTVMMREALYRYFLKNNSQAGASIYRAASACAAVLRLALLGIGVLSPSRDARTRRKILIAKSWSVIAWSVGQRKWAASAT